MKRMRVRIAEVNLVTSEASSENTSRGKSMPVEIEVVEEPKGVFTISVDKRDTIVVESHGVSVVVPKGFVDADLLWLLKAACYISGFLLMKRISTLEEVRSHLNVHKKLWEME